MCCNYVCVSVLLQKNEKSEGKKQIKHGGKCPNAKSRCIKSSTELAAADLTFEYVGYNAIVGVRQLHSNSNRMAMVMKISE